MIPYPVLLCDIRSDFTRFGFVHGPDEEAISLSRLRTTTFRDLVVAARHALELAEAAGDGFHPASLIACVAGPVTGHNSYLRGNGLQVDGAAIARQLDLEFGLLLSSLEVLAMSLSIGEPGCNAHGVMPELFRPLGAVRPAPDAKRQSRFALMLEDELGAAVLIDTGRRLLGMPVQIDVLDITPASPEEEKIWPHLPRRYGKVTAGSLLSAAGISSLFRARALSLSVDPPDLPVDRIIDHASADPGGISGWSLRTFWRIAARFSGDMALAFQSGGVTLGGQVLLDAEKVLDPTDFRMQFERKGQKRGWLTRVAVSRLIRDDALIHGMAAIAANPSRFAVDYASREWA